MTEALLTMNALSALYGLATSTLVRVTVEYNANKLYVQTILLASSSEADVDNLQAFSTELLSNFYDAVLDEEIVFVREPAEASGISERGIRIYAVAGAQYMGRDN